MANHIEFIPMASQKMRQNPQESSKPPASSGTSFNQIFSKELSSKKNAPSAKIQDKKIETSPALKNSLPETNKISNDRSTSKTNKNSADDTTTQVSNADVNSTLNTTNPSDYNFPSNLVEKTEAFVAQNIETNFPSTLNSIDFDLNISQKNSDQISEFMINESGNSRKEFGINKEAEFPLNDKTAINSNQIEDDSNTIPLIAFASTLNDIQKRDVSVKNTLPEERKLSSKNIDLTDQTDPKIELNSEIESKLSPELNIQYKLNDETKQQATSQNEKFDAIGEDKNALKTIPFTVNNMNSIQENVKKLELNTENTINKLDGISSPNNLTTLVSVNGNNSSILQNMHLSPKVGSPNWDQAIGQKVVWLINGGIQTAELTLSPPDLGPMQVVLNISNDQANIMFSSEHVDVRDALESSMPKLRQMMQDAGIQLSGFSINSDKNNANQSNQGNHSQANRAHSQPTISSNETQISTSTNSRVNALNIGLINTFA